MTKVDIAMCAVFALLALSVGAQYFYERGERRGICVELCRPAKFDTGQKVNGGCLCIGSDEVRRIRKAP